jgi:3-hydroxyacyl-[acyl-carrier-protein] dehydratase
MALDEPDRGVVKFYLIDKIESVSAERLVGIKVVSLAEEYLADHFPTFPVLPGVLMLEALTQAAAWCLHARHGFAKSIAVLKEARNVKYGKFVAPGDTLRLEVELVRLTDGPSPGDFGGVFKGVGTVAGSSALTARLQIAYFNLADTQSDLAGVDQRLIEHHRGRWDILTHGSVAGVLGVQA